MNTIYVIFNLCNTLNIEKIRKKNENRRNLEHLNGEVHPAPIQKDFNFDEGVYINDFQ